MPQLHLDLNSKNEDKNIYRNALREQEQKLRYWMLLQLVLQLQLQLSVSIVIWGGFLGAEMEEMADGVVGQPKPTAICGLEATSAATVVAATATATSTATETAAPT